MHVSNNNPVTIAIIETRALVSFSERVIKMHVSIKIPHTATIL